MTGIEPNRRFKHLSEYVGRAIERDIPEDDVIFAEIDVRCNSLLKNPDVSGVFKSRFEPCNQFAIDIDSSNRINFGRDQIGEDPFTCPEFQHSLLLCQVEGAY
ncbi:MAG: hypothetical protein V3T49_00990 [Dehalococcoidia bacterium]